MHLRLWAVAAATLVLAGCGDGDEAAPVLTVGAASSLTDALRECSPRFEGAQVRVTFGGSDDLAAQARQGVPLDVVAAANTEIPEQLAAEGVGRAPRVYATNELVLAVPADGDEVTGLDDLTQDGVSLVVGAASVPVGSYTAQVLERLPATQRDAIADAVRSEEPDVKGVIGKVAQGAADAGFAYRTDVTATNGRLRAIALPDDLRPVVTYGAATLGRAQDPTLADRFVEDLISGGCATTLREAGFGAPARP